MNNRKIMRSAWLGVGLLALLLVAEPVFAQTAATCTAQAGGILDSISTKFSGATNGWANQAQIYAKHIFAVLAGLEFGWAAIQYVLQKNDLNEYLVAMLFKIMALSFFGLFLIAGAPTYIPDIINGFTQMGQGIGGSSILPTIANGMISPSAVMSMGTCLASHVISSPYQSIQNASILSSGFANNFFELLMALVSAGFIALAYGFAALQLLFTQIESYIVIGAGAVMLGFLGSRWTSSWGERIFGYAVSIGVKLMVVYLVVGLGQSLVSDYISTSTPQAVQSNSASATSSQTTTGTQTIITPEGQTVQVPSSSGPAPMAIAPGDYITLVMVSILFGGVALMLPGVAGSFLNGSPNMSLGNMGGAMAGMAAAGTALAAGGAAPAIAGAKKLTSLASAATGRSGGGDDGGFAALGRLTGTPGGGGGSSSALSALASGTGKGMQAAGKSVETATAGAGTTMKGAGTALSAVPGVGQIAGGAMQAAGTGVETAGKVAGKTIATTGKATEATGNAVGKTADAVGNTMGKAATHADEMPGSQAAMSAGQGTGETSSASGTPRTAPADEIRPPLPASTNNVDALGGGHGSNELTPRLRPPEQNDADDRNRNAYAKKSLDERLMAVAKNQASKAHQHLVTPNDGQTGTASIRLNHPE